MKPLQGTADYQQGYSSATLLVALFLYRLEIRSMESSQTSLTTVVGYVKGIDVATHFVRPPSSRPNIIGNKDSLHPVVRCARSIVCHASQMGEE